MIRICISMGIVVCLCAPAMSQSSTLTRDRDPVVLLGANVPTLVGLEPNHVVAFRYLGGWQQIPVQIDERKLVDFYVVYNGAPGGFTTMAYADPTTYTGADEDTTFDADDELVVMARDAGDRAGDAGGLPAGVLAGRAVEIAVSDSLNGGQAYVYLFETDGTLAPDAGQAYVSYAYNMLTGTYIPDYNTSTGPNPEDSEVITPYYHTHFSERWVCDRVNVLAGGATGVDILDRCKVLLGPGECGRNEDSFSTRAHNWPGEGAFFTNKTGPIRAIRSYMGANSGILTQRQHVFYEQRQDVSTFLRVHGIPGVMDFYDYSPEAAGMTYYNNLNLQGAVIDGQPDAVTTGPIVWEMATGPQGSLLMAHLPEVDFSPFVYTSYYSDDLTPSYTQCTGDAWEYASSGLWVNTPIPNTDPILAPQYGYYSILTLRRIVFYEPPAQTVQTAALRYTQAGAPLGAQVSDFHLTRTLALRTVNSPWGQVLLSPEPADANDPNRLAYPSGAVVSLTAAPIPGRAFGQWTVYDPNHPDDANFAAMDANTVLVLTMDANRQVEATFKCGGSAGPMLIPTLGLLGLWGGLAGLRGRRFGSRP